MLAEVDIVEKGKTYFKGRWYSKHQSWEYILWDCLAQGGKEETILYPRIQMNPTFGMMSSPDIMRNATKDLYACFRPMDKSVWTSGAKRKSASESRSTIFVNDYVAVLNEVKPVTMVAGF